MSRRKPKDTCDIELPDIEDLGRQYFPEQIEKVRWMRRNRDAPVDSLEAQGQDDVAPNVKRFHILVSLMLSSQTRDEVNIRCMKRLYARGCTVESMLAMDLEELTNILYPVCFYKTKARHIKAACEMLKAWHEGRDPPTPVTYRTPRVIMPDEEGEEVDSEPMGFETPEITTPTGLTFDTSVRAEEVGEATPTPSIPLDSSPLPTTSQQREKVDVREDTDPPDTYNCGQTQHSKESQSLPKRQSPVVEESQSRQPPAASLIVPSCPNVTMSIRDEEVKLEERPQSLEVSNIRTPSKQQAEDSRPHEDAATLLSHTVESEKLLRDAVDALDSFCAQPTKRLKTEEDRNGDLVDSAAQQKNLNSAYDVPDTFEDICKLPGVGPKMATLLMQLAWGQTVGIAVDLHVHRISNRLGWVTTTSPEATKAELESFVPESLWRDVNLLLVGFGQQICKKRSPKCKKCDLFPTCPYGRQLIVTKK